LREKRVFLLGCLHAEHYEEVDHEQIRPGKELVVEAADDWAVEFDCVPVRSHFLEGARHNAVGALGVKEVIGEVVEAELVDEFLVAVAEV
jgi:hypothetical protein